jgi:hypothetical protein
MDYDGREDVFVHHADDTNSATVYFADGTLTTPVYIPRAGQYQFTVVHKTLDAGQIGELILLDAHQNRVASAELPGAASKETGMTYMVADLEAGEYQFVLRFSEETTPTPVRFLLPSGENNILEDAPNQFAYRPAASRSWAIVSTDDIPTHGNTYRLSYELSTYALQNVHIKFLFFDDSQQELPIVKYIGGNCHWPDGSTLCTSYQDIITVPENVDFMRIQILGQADPELSGQLNIETFDLVSLDQYFAIERLLIQNVRSTTNQNQPVEIADESQRAWPDLALSLDYAEEIEVVVWRESPSKLWQISGEQTGPALPINGVHQGFWVSGGNPVHISTSLDTIYKLGVGLSVFTLVVLVATWAIEYWSTRD